MCFVKSAWALGLFVCLPWVALAQAPLLQLGEPQLTARGWQVTITNPYSQAATAFVLDFTSPERPLPSGGPLARRYEDAVPGSGGRPLLIAAGASKPERLGLSRYKEVSYKIEAVVYADGSSAGDPAEVERILQVRRAALDDIKAVLPMLQQAENDPSLKADIPGLVGQFRQRAVAHTKELHPSRSNLNLPSVDFVCGLIWTNLERPAPGIPLDHEISALASILTKWEAVLKASKPDLASVKDPILLQ